jgi:uncharacterized protein YbjT (DUF2867 family)
MQITVIGASGLIGTKVVDLLTAEGHDVIAASRASGVDVLTGDGLAEALRGADALVDVVNSPSFEDDPVMEFFTKSATNLVDAAKRAGVGHYVCLSIVGIDDLTRQWIHEGQGRSGEGHHRSRHPLHDRACHAVRRIYRRHHGIHDGR